MAEIFRVDYYPNDYYGGTRTLTPEQRGIYWDVCTLIFMRGSPIDYDFAWLADALAVDIRVARRTIAALIEAGKLFVVVREDGRSALSNVRALRELQVVEARIGRKDRPNFRGTSAGSSEEVPEKSGHESSKDNGL